MRAYERFLKYVKIDTTSADDVSTAPTTACQWDLAKLLETELNELGMSDVKVSEYCVVTAVLPATPGYEDAPAIGLIAHLDTSPAFPGANIEPILHENYNGEDIVLPKDGRVIRVSDYPRLKSLKGSTLITADGSTLLGGDDKAGIAEIMTLCEELIANNIPHGKICVGFTPDEEVGAGTAHFDVPAFGAKYAYTLDGSLEGSISYENFNAASALIEIEGVSVHPGGAKGRMQNALRIGMELNAMLPETEVPECTADREGFYHLTDMKGDVASASMKYIIRDHDMTKFLARKAKMEEVVAAVQAAHPTAAIRLTLSDTYYNMLEKLKDCMHLIENAKLAAQKAGLTPTEGIIRGGTDGATLAYMGLPCPNLGTGSANGHGPYEYAVVESMDKVVEVLHHINALYREKK